MENLASLANTYAPFCFYAGKTRYDGFDAAVKANGFMPAFRDSFKNITANLESLGNPQIADRFNNIFLEYPKVFVDPFSKQAKDSFLGIIDDFKREKEIRLPFPKVVLFIGTLISETTKVSSDDKYGFYAEAAEVDGNKFDSAYVIFLEQVQDIYVKATLFVAKGFDTLVVKLQEIIIGPDKQGTMKAIGKHHYLNRDAQESLLTEILYAIHKLTFQPGEVYISKPTPQEIQINKKKLRKHKAPLIEFRLIKVEGRKPTIPSLPQGTHASPRQHWRRGHWRNCKSGKRVFVHPALIGDEKNGKIIKDYMVGDSTHAH
jgi:hypothetical protein